MRPAARAPLALPVLCGAAALLSLFGGGVPGAAAAVAFAAVAVLARRGRPGIAGWAAALGLGWGAWSVVRGAMLLVSAIGPTRPVALPWQVARHGALAVLGAAVFAVAVAMLVAGRLRPRD